MPTALIVVLAIVGFAVFFVGLWLGVTLLVSLGGWRRLAAHYRTDDERPPGKRFSGVSGFVGRANYRNALNVVLAEEGLHLSTISLFKLRHPPLLIPWSDLTEERGGRFLLAYDGFRIRPADVRLVIYPKRIAEAVRGTLRPTP